MNLFFERGDLYQPVNTLDTVHLSGLLFVIRFISLVAVGGGLSMFFWYTAVNGA